jgi:hypothetical protein
MHTIRSMGCFGERNVCVGRLEGEKGVMEIARIIIEAARGQRESERQAGQAKPIIRSVLWHERF